MPTDAVSVIIYSVYLDLAAFWYLSGSAYFLIGSDHVKKWEMNEVLLLVDCFNRVYVPISDIVSLIKGNSFALAKSVLGATAMNSLMERYNPKTPADLKAKLERAGEASILLPIEIDKDHLSSGEKQIFVMSLYWAMMNQSSNDLPFIIDTPFARIDTEHRANITEHFFRNLSGELVILSTDEELSNSHLKAMSDQIAHVYMLEYTEDKRTSIQSGKYFEV